MFTYISDVAQSEKLCSQILTLKIPIAIDFEGVHLCRKGELCLVQIGLPTGEVYLLDVVEMKNALFEQGKLRAVLESTYVLKYVYDCRADSDALYYLYNVTLQNAFDVQILFCKTRDIQERKRDKFVKGLKTAIGMASLSLEKEINSMVF